MLVGNQMRERVERHTWVWSDLYCFRITWVGFDGDDDELVMVIAWVHGLKLKLPMDSPTTYIHIYQDNYINMAFDLQHNTKS